MCFDTARAAISANLLIEDSPPQYPTRQVYNWGRRSHFEYTESQDSIRDAERIWHRMVREGFIKQGIDGVHIAPVEHGEYKGVSERLTELNKAQLRFFAPYCYDKNMPLVMEVPASEMTPKDYAQSYIQYLTAAVIATKEFLVERELRSSIGR